MFHMYFQRLTLKVAVLTVYVANLVLQSIAVLLLTLAPRIFIEDVVKYLSFIGCIEVLQSMYIFRCFKNIR